LLTWVTSTASHRCDAASLIAHGHRMGSIVGVDITQGVGLLPFTATSGADFVVSTSLKWLCGVPGAGCQVLGADDVVTHLVALQQVAEILLVQRRQALRQVAHAGAARQVPVIVHFLLRQHQGDMGKAAGGGVAALFARRAFQQVAQQRTAREQRQPWRLPDGVGVEDVVDLP